MEEEMDAFKKIVEVTLDRMKTAGVGSLALNGDV